jgi:hypothetical protein
MRPHSPICTAAARRLLTALSAVALVAALAPSSAALAATPTKVPTAETVIVVLSPFLTWDDVAGVVPNSLRVAGSEGAVANMNAITGDAGWPTVAGGALTLSAGRWTASPIGAAADPRQLAAIKAANAASLDPPDIGALGSAIHAAGLRTAAVGNSDENTSTSDGVRRPAALLAMDRNGKVDLQLTSPGLLMRDATAPFGVRADPKQMRTAIRIALYDQPALLVIDAGDLERAHDAPGQSAEQSAKSHRDAVQRLSELVADVRSAVGTRSALLMIVTPATDKPYYQPPYLAPTIVSGLGLRGELTSSSTHRPGLVTNLDFAPTVLTALGIKPDLALVGQPMIAEAGAQPAKVDAAIQGLDRLNTSVGAVDYLRDLFFIRYFAWASVFLAAFVTAVSLVPSLRLWASIGRWLILLGLAIPAGAWLMFVVQRYPVTPTQAAIAFGLATAATFALVVALSLARRARAEVPLLALSTLTSLLIVVDQWTGHPLETGLFSYSIRAGWRYYGMGNEGAALLVAALVVIDTMRSSGQTHLARFAGDAMRGNFTAVADLVYRKASNNLGYISQTPYTWLAIALAGALAAVRWAGEQPLVAALRERPGVAGALAGVIVGGIVAALTEDSGVVMPALMLFAGALPALYLALPAD